MRENDRKGHEKARVDAVRSAVGKLKPGEVISVPNGKRGGLGVIVSVREGQADGAHAGPAVLPAGRA